MTHTIAKSAQSVQIALDAHNLECKVIEFPASTRTAQEAADAIGCTVAQIVKSLIFKTKDTNLPVLVLASGPNRVNEKIIESHVGQAITKADADFAREVTGFAIGGIPPIGHKQHISFIFIDQDLLQHETVWAAAGTPNAVFSIASAQLPVISQGKIISVL